MTADFGQLKKLEPGAQVIEYPMFQLEGRPVLKVKHAGRTNRGYANAVDKMNAKASPLRRIAQGKLDRRTIDAAREDSRELFAKHVVIGWEGVLDTSDKPAEFSEDNCRAFLFALPDYLFEELLRFCTDPTNFLPDMPDEEEIEAQAGN